MKQLLFLALIVPSLAMAQIGEVKVAKKKTPIGKFGDVEMYYTVTDGDTTNFILFKNARYSTLNDFQAAAFVGGVKERKQLENMILSCFKEENMKDKDFTLNFTLGSDKIMLFYTRGYAVFYVGDDYFLMSEKQVHKLFGDE